MELKLGDLVCDTQKNALAGPERTVRLEPKAVEVLAFLADRPGRVTGKDGLIESAWNGRVVSDAALTGVISQLRKAIKAAGSRRVRIQTHSKRGYSLEIADAADSAVLPVSVFTAKFRWAAGLASLAVVVVMSAVSWAWVGANSVVPAGIAIKSSVRAPDGKTSGSNFRFREGEVLHLGSFHDDKLAISGEVRSLGEKDFEVLLVMRSQTRWEERRLRLPYRETVRMSFEAVSGGLPYEIELIAVPVYSLPE